jgi:serine/threonine protein kinase
MVRQAVDSASKFDAYVDQFESAWAQGPPGEIESFLPPVGDEFRNRVLLELVRVDLERRWDQGDDTSIDVYLEEYPELRTDRASLGDLAYEEYRLRLQAHRPKRSDVFARQYGVDVSAWPAGETVEDTTAIRAARESTFRILETESERLVGGIVAFPELGSEFLGFRLVERLGQGKFSAVYLATQADLADRQVVLKLSTELWSESQKLARLQHSNIVPVYSVHHEGRIQALCMPYLGRHTLDQLLGAPASFGADRNGNDMHISLETGTRSNRSMVAPAVDGTSGAMLRTARVPHALTPDSDWKGSAKNAPPISIDGLPAAVQRWARAVSGPVGQSLDRIGSEREKACCDLIARLGDGVAHAHRRGIVHRDLKPANVLITEDGEPMLLDFNLSDDVVVGGRASAMVGGTVPYMAPEQLAAIISGERLDQRCDMFSLGVLLFQLLTGTLPFPVRSGSFAESIAHMISDRRRGDWQGILRRVASADVCSIVMRCLAPRAADRYASGEEMTRDLRNHMHDLPLESAPNRSPKQRVQKWLRRNRHRLTLGTVGTAAVRVITAASLVAGIQYRRVSRLTAEQDLRKTTAEIQEVLPLLEIPDLPLELRTEVRERAATVLARHDLTGPNGAVEKFLQSPGYYWLDATRRIELRQRIAELATALAHDLHDSPAPGRSTDERQCRSIAKRLSKAQTDTLAAIGNRDHSFVHEGPSIPRALEKLRNGNSRQPNRSWPRSCLDSPGTVSCGSCTAMRLRVNSGTMRPTRPIHGLGPCSPILRWRSSIGGLPA